MPDPTLSEAIQEAYAHAPSDAIILHTLELRHPDFRDDSGQPSRHPRGARPGRLDRSA
jgi:hypothetical protein